MGTMPCEEVGITSDRLSGTASSYSRNACVQKTWFWGQPCAGLGGASAAAGMSALAMTRGPPSAMLGQLVAASTLPRALPLQPQSEGGMVNNRASTAQACRRGRNTALHASQPDRCHHPDLTMQEGNN